MIITLDGPAGVGKSSLATYLSRHYQIMFLKSGAFYRALSLALQRSFPEELPRLEEFYQDFLDGDETAEEIWHVVLNFAMFLEINQQGERIYIGAEDVSELLQTPEMDAITPLVSRFSPFRQRINSLLHEQAQNASLVAEGRDMGTVVFPDADYKFFIDASVEVRARRRFLQQGEQGDLAELQKFMEERDKIDRNKEEGALKAAEGAIIIDTSSLTFEDVCQIITGHISSDFVKSEHSS